MAPQNLEDLLHRRSFLFSESVDIQILVDSALADLRALGRPFVVTRLFTNTPVWLGRRVTVPSADSGTKTLVVMYDDKMERMKVDLVFFYPDEVKEF